MMFTKVNLSKIGIVFLLMFFQGAIFAQIIVPTAGCSSVETFDLSNPWTFGGVNSTWTWANPNKLDVPDDISIGGKALILGGNTTTSTYNQNEESWAESPVYDLSAVNNPYLSFNFYWSNEGSTSFDEIWMEYSLNNGATWSDLSTPIGTGSCYDQNWYNYPDNWGGNVGGCFPGLGGPTGWVLVRKCINALANESSVKFRFRISTGTTCQNFGATVDEFKVCDASITALASYQCTPLPLEIEFFDESFDCPTNWKWYFGDGDSSDFQSPIHTYPASGIYTVNLIVATNPSVTSGCGGPYQDVYTFEVEVIEALLDDQTNVTCFGLDDGNAKATIIGAKPNAILDWQPIPVFGQGTDSISSLSAGTYVLTVTGENPTCSASTTVVITAPTEIITMYNAIDASCFSVCDGTLEANISGGVPPYNAVWTPGNFSGLTISSVCSGAYDVTIEDSNGCQLNDLTAATVGQPPAAVIYNIEDTTICLGNSVNLDNFLTSAGVTSMSWSVISGGDIGFGLAGTGNIPNFTASNTAVALIEVVPSVDLNCIGLPDTFSITVQSTPTPDFTITKQNGNCEPLNVQFEVLNSVSSSNYIWDFGNGSNKKQGNPISFNFNAGIHSVILKEESVNGCVGTVEKVDLISVSQKPLARFNFSPEYYTELGTEIIFNNLSENATDYEWQIIDTDFSSVLENPSFTLLEEGKGYYEIRLIATNLNGCIDSVNRFIELREPEIIYVPNAFSPYNSNANNEFKPIVQSGIDIYKYQLSIYNRWGELVFVSHDPSIGWNGLTSNSQRVLPGVYAYNIQYSNKYIDQPKTIIGAVTLVD